MVREWDPGTAPETEIEDMLRALNEVLAADLPDEPRWHIDLFREYLSATLPDERRIAWIGDDHSDAHGNWAATGKGFKAK